MGDTYYGSHGVLPSPKHLPITGRMTSKDVKLFIERAMRPVLDLRIGESKREDARIIVAIGDSREGKRESTQTQLLHLGSDSIPEPMVHRPDDLTHLEVTVWKHESLCSERTQELKAEIANVAKQTAIIRSDEELMALFAAYKDSQAVVLETVAPVHRLAPCPACRFWYLSEDLYWCLGQPPHAASLRQTHLHSPLPVACTTCHQLQTDTPECREDCDQGRALSPQVRPPENGLAKQEIFLSGLAAESVSKKVRIQRTLMDEFILASSDGNPVFPQLMKPFTETEGRFKQWVGIVELGNYLPRRAILGPLLALGCAKIIHILYVLWILLMNSHTNNSWEVMHTPRRALEVNYRGLGVKDQRCRTSGGACRRGAANNAGCITVEELAVHGGPRSVCKEVESRLADAVEAKDKMGSKSSVKVDRMCELSKSPDTLGHSTELEETWQAFI
ncbi:hypothetical protein CONPUDRAFT_75433 [Coniophora puteana RWD-64-598 SS2]|uniref:Uncharacterized protein n=1 Tax=Coniophora puteana (strain RWD-64-598) TaxID=741705 RepID=A0A5M3MG56_CONPW|nr:uncharacterized protein CONPUDRAFT_75433 [Coniophora puteana RWD-64-598 SS2]EIW77581.1 hypothetical protein CONPUDRAFT_75433 [Coniophora puteana RWD-64-598 SS2]